MKSATIKNSPDADTLKCPKCGCTWQAKGHYNFDEGGWSYDYNDDLCPKGCKGLFGFIRKGKIIS